MLKTTKGITLISLVVTIVVLLILAGIAINLAIGNNGIIIKAIEAKQKTDNSAIDEQQQFNQINDEIVGMTVDRTGLDIGEYVDYKPTPTDTLYTNIGENYTGSTNNPTSIGQDKLDWQILRINTNKSVDLIGTATSQSIYFRGVLGYNNGVYLMNDICEKLYSNTKLKARSVNMNDLNLWLTDEAKTTRDKFNNGYSIYGKVYQYKGIYPRLFAEENGGAINTTTINTNGIGPSDSTSANLTMPTQEKFNSADPIMVTQTFWYTSGDSINSTNFGDGAKPLTSNIDYWIASRYTSCGSTYAGFGLQKAGKSLSGAGMCDTTNSSFSSQYCFRPVVTVPPTIEINVCTGANSPTNMHKIVY